MRSAAVVSLFAVAGCNQFFGLEDTHIRDAPPPNALPYASLLYAVPKVETLDGGLGKPRGVSFVPVPAGDVAIRVGPPEGPLAAAEYGENGEIKVFEALIGQPWRLEYTLGGVVHELLWNPPRDVGRAVVPVFGGFGRAPMPAGAGYAVTPKRSSPPSAPASVTAGRAFTTGVWATFELGAQAAPVPVRLDVPPRIGGVGRPDASRADHVILVDYLDAQGCTLAKGSGAAAAPDPGGASVPLEVPWAFTTNDVAFFTYKETPVFTPLRLAGALGTRSGTEATFTSFGYTAEVGMPPFAPDARGNLPLPPLVELARCTGFVANTPMNPVYADVIALENYPRLAQALITNTRTSSPTGPELRSGMVALASSPDDPTQNNALQLELRASFALAPRLAAPGVMLDLGLSDQAAFPTGTTTIDLTFELETGVAQPDFLEVTLYRVQSSADPAQRRLVAERVYVNANVAAPKFTIDADVLAKGVEYVFALRTYNGRPNANTGDFTVVTYPQTVTTIFTRTFIAQ
ncbi:MAG: hypothetical protein KF773_40930 [Deltaproteobacteria bacterium]|nr:hypothetical protein [Deltaproteobacteria bacterium]MCW5807233.1 hypothetical protein [Deltaproteobacteria bacterium]